VRGAEWALARRLSMRRQPKRPIWQARGGLKAYANQAEGVAVGTRQVGGVWGAVGRQA